MMFPFAVPVCISDSVGNSKWPAVRVEVRHGRGLVPRVRCSLSIPGRRAFPVSNAAGSPGSVWFGSAGLWTKGFKAALEYHHKASAATLQTLQRVGTLIRSTSMDYIAALGPKASARQQPSPNAQPPGNNNGPTEGQLKASLGRFLTTASKAEVSQTAMLSDLSNMAYDVARIDIRSLQEMHNLTMVAHSKAAQLPAPSAEAGLTTEPEAVTPLLMQSSSEVHQQVQSILPTRPQSPFATGMAAAAAAGLPQSPAAAGAPPSSYQSSSSNNHQQPITGPASPRTPFVLSSFTESDDILAPATADMQLATAAGAVDGPATPRRRSSAITASSSSSSLAAAPTAFEPPVLQASASAGATLAAQLLQYQQQEQMEATAAFLHQYQMSAEMSEQHAMQELQQHEQQLLLEMQHTQQLQLLLQQEQAILQQLQEQASLDTTDSSSSSEAAAANSSGTWWWLQQLQQNAAAAAAAATALSNSSASSTEEPPADWFVCDGPATAADSGPVRYFVIQGSISLDHWRINLTIDPCEFEGGALGGIKVHRGVYEAALQMLDSFVPFVREHLEKHPDGKIAFTGHSLGGSLATLLMLVMVHRGLLPAANLANVITFGSPAIFCEGATGSTPSAGACNSCSLPCQHRAERAAASAAAGAAAAAAKGAASPTRSPCDNGVDLSAASDSANRVVPGAADGGVLGRLGLAPETVVNVIMTRDIVPRAFVCDYTLVADVLKNWLPSFKEHVGLAACREHKALYNFIGTIEVLQPSLDCPFVLPDEAHSMLPPHAALYKLTEPCCTIPQLASDAANTAAEAHDTDAPAAMLTTSACASCKACSCGGCSNTKDTTEHVDVSSSSSGGADNCSDSACDAAQESKSKGKKLRRFSSWGSLASLSSMNLTSAIADLANSFTLISSNSSGSIVSVPVTAEEAAADAAAAAASKVADAPDAAVQQDAAIAPECECREAVTSEASSSNAVVDGEAAAVAVSTPLTLTLGDAILTFMNSPHPLETLGEMRAYGPAGSISRFHNPTSYTIALQQLVTDNGST